MSYPGVRGDWCWAFRRAVTSADSPGADLIVSENAFGSDSARFAELFRVAVSFLTQRISPGFVLVRHHAAVPSYGTIDHELGSAALPA